MPRPVRRVVVSTLLITSALLATACETDSATDDDASSPESTMPAVSPPPAPTGPAWTSFTGPLQRCGPQPAGVIEAPFEPITLRDRAVGRIPAVRLGGGQVVVVLLHQTDGNGLCGWLPFMPAAADAGLAVLAIDLCSYGESDCRAVAEGTFTDADQTDAVAVAVDYARTELRARRVIVAGASMGGSVALISAATLPGIDAAVDLSGPAEWDGMDVVRRGRALDVPVLVAMATSEGPEEAAGAQEIVANAPAGSVLLTPEDGHGYVLLNDSEGAVLPLAKDVLHWIKQRGQAV
jgi:pimeloyl-ACP methyl ester carboxylesterase